MTHHKIAACIDVITPNETEAEVLTGVTVTDNDSAQEVIKVSMADVDSAKFQYKQSKGTYYPTISVRSASIRTRSDQ